MDVPAFGESDRVGVVIGLMDWVGHGVPENDDLAGHPILEQAASRFDAITLAGGQVLGLRPLEIDGLVAKPFVGAGHRVWGALTIRNLAEQYFTP
jgi:hypothetical protein